MPEYKLALHRGVWCLRWNDNGNTKRASLGTPDLAAARLRQAEVIRAMEQRSRPNPTTSDLWAKYREHLAGRPAAMTMVHEAKTILPVFGAHPPMDITPKMVAEYTAKRRAQGRSDGTVLTELNRLASCFNWAVKRRLVETAPHIDRPAAPPPRTEWLTKEQARVYLDACTQKHIRTFVTLALTTGARASAVLDLQWDRVDLDRGLVDFTTGEARRGTMKGRSVVPLNAMAASALADARKTALSDFVIEWSGGKVASVKKGIATAAVASGLDFVTPHVFRHSAAVWMAEAGRPMAEIAQFLGHKDPRLTERVYARFSPSFLRGAAAALEF